MLRSAFKTLSWMRGLGEGCCIVPNKEQEWALAVEDKRKEPLTPALSPRERELKTKSWEV